VTQLPSDDEMKRRIAKHQAQRPKAWKTFTASLDIVAILEQIQEPVILLDCFSGYVSNLLLKYAADGEELVLENVLDGVTELLEHLKQANKTVIIVSNEVCAGVVPAYPLGRWYRDALGFANQRAAKAADAVALLTVGIPQTLKGKFPEVEDDF